MGLLDLLLAEDRALLESLQEIREVPSGTVLFHQGDPADTAVLLQEGQLALELYSPGRPHPIDVGISTPGDLLGEPALVADAWRSRTAVARTDITIGLLHRKDMRSLMSSFHPGSLRIVLAVARHVVGRLQGADTEANEAVPISTHDGVRASGMDPRPYLPKFPFFRGFTSSDLDALVQLGTLWDVERGTPLVRQGQHSSTCFIVVRGAVAVREGDTRIGMIGPGRPAGEMAPLTGRPTSADLVMRETGTVLEIGPEAFATLTTPEHRVAFKFTNALATTLMETMARTNRQRARQALHTPATGPRE